MSLKVPACEEPPSPLEQLEEFGRVVVLRLEQTARGLVAISLLLCVGGLMSPFVTTTQVGQGPAAGVTQIDIVTLGILFNCKHSHSLQGPEGQQPQRGDHQYLLDPKAGNYSCEWLWPKEGTKDTLMDIGKALYTMGIVFLLLALVYSVRCWAEEHTIHAFFKKCACVLLMAAMLVFEAWKDRNAWPRLSVYNLSLPGISLALVSSILDSLKAQLIRNFKINMENAYDM